MKNNTIMVTTTCPNKEVAKNIAQSLLEQGYAACIQMIDHMQSFYIWNNAIQSDTEILLLIKSMDYHFENIEKTILTEHPYDIPQIISFDISRTHTPYEKWIKSLLTNDS